MFGFVVSGGRSFRSWNVYPEGYDFERECPRCGCGCEKFFFSEVEGSYFGCEQCVDVKDLYEDDPPCPVCGSEKGYELYFDQKGNPCGCSECVDKEDSCEVEDFGPSCWEGV